MSDVGSTRVLASLSIIVVLGAIVACGSSAKHGGTAGAGSAGSGLVMLGESGASGTSAPNPIGSGGSVSVGASGANASSAGSSALGGAGASGMSTTTAGVSGHAGSAGSAGGQAGSSTAGGKAASGCGTRSGMRGKTSRQVTVMGDNRTFIAYLPMDSDPTMPLPFVYVFHGASQTGQELYDMTEYAKLADTEKIAVVFPDGQGVSSATGAGSLTPWDVTDGGGLCGLGTLVSNPNPEDFPFMDAIKADVENDQCLDDQHIFATGFSMGGYFTHHIACERTDIRAAAPHSGGTLGDLSSCTTKHVPIIAFHGVADPLIDDACDDLTVASEAGFPASGTLWAMKNGCKNTYTTMVTDGPTGKGQCYIYDGCPADGQVEVCTFTDMEHAWAGAPVCENCIGDGMGWASATQLEWAFFKKYAW